MFSIVFDYPFEMLIVDKHSVTIKNVLKRNDIENLHSLKC